MKLVVIDCGGGVLWSVEGADTIQEANAIVARLRAEPGSRDAEYQDLYRLRIEHDANVAWERVGDLDDEEGAAE